MISHTSFTLLTGVAFPVDLAGRRRPHISARRSDNQGSGGFATTRLVAPSVLPDHSYRFIMAPTVFPTWEDIKPVENMPHGCVWGLFDKDGQKDNLGSECPCPPIFWAAFDPAFSQL